MAISTQTEALIDVYTQQISLNQSQIEQSNSILNGYTINRGPDYPEIKIWGPQEVIDNFTPSINALDSKIVEVNGEIQALQYQILSVGLAANAVGCGTTTPASVLRDNVNYRQYSYTSPNPFSDTVGILTVSTIGYGVSVFTDKTAIGAFYTEGNWNQPQCSTYTSSIASLQSQIDAKVGIRSDLIEKVNVLKEQRSSFELQKYAHNESINKLNTQIGICSSMIQFLQDPANDQWL